MSTVITVTQQIMNEGLIVAVDLCAAALHSEHPYQLSSKCLKLNSVNAGGIDRLSRWIRQVGPEKRVRMFMGLLELCMQ